MAAPDRGRDLTASTINKWLAKKGGLKDCAYAGVHVLDTLREKGKRQTKRGVPQKKSAWMSHDGGDYIQDTPILYKSAGPTNITGDEVIPGVGHNPFGKALWPIAMKGDIVQISEFDKIRNAGKQKMVDEWQGRIQEKISAMLYAVNYDICARDSGTGESSYTGVNGLPWLIDVAGQGDTKSVAGITRSSSVLGWTNRKTTSCGAFATYYSKLGLQQALCEGSTVGGGIWDLIITTPTIWAAIRNFFTGLGEVDLQSNTDPDAGYRYFTWNGAKVVMDENITAGYIYGLSTEDMWFCVDPAHDFHVGESAEAPNQFVTARKLSFAGNLGFRRFSGAGVTTGWS